MPAVNEYLPWDSEFFGMRIGRSIGYDDTETLAWGVKNNIDLHYLLVDVMHPGQAQQAEHDGWRYMDTRVTFARTTAVLPGLRSVRPAFPEDRAWLRPIARNSFRITRFYADLKLDNRRCDDLYDDWLTGALDDPAKAVLVALSNDATPVGFVTLSLHGARASLDLIAVARTARAQGVGNALVTDAIDWAAKEGAEEITVVTQGRNIEAQRLFQSCFFRTVSMKLWLHRWYP